METLDKITDPNEQARCPNCKAVHTIGPYSLRHEDGKRIAAPPDHCPPAHGARLPRQHGLPIADAVAQRNPA